jgi:prepilin signal peptidase PulO-like enzyme (type II secretory pathway)
MEQFINLIIFIFGTAIGSFLNVLIDRLPLGENILGRSHCDYCRKKIAWFDLFPIISFIFLRGRCRYCHKKLNFQYPLVEMLTGISFLLIFDFLPTGSGLNLIAMWGLISSLIVIFFSDLKYHLISDYILLALLIFSLSYGLTSGISISQFPHQLTSALIVAAPIFLIYFLSRERAMGLGDVYLSAIIGLLLGWKAGFLALYIGFVTGALVGIALIVMGKRGMKSKIALAPFLVIGLITILFWKEKIFEIISKIYG